VRENVEIDESAAVRGIVEFDDDCVFRRRVGKIYVRQRSITF